MIFFLFIFVLYSRHFANFTVIYLSSPCFLKNIITDGNPSYQNAVHFLNKSFPENKLTLKNVIGLQNIDVVSTQFRPFKQLIKRLNRTYKFHMRDAGFSSKEAVSLITLFVTFYNFLRPYMSLNYNVPVHLDFLKGFDTLQGRLVSFINVAIAL